MLKTLLRMDKMTSLHQRLDASRMLQGFGFSSDDGNTSTNVPIDDAEELEDEDEAVVWEKSQDESEFDVQLAARPRMSEILRTELLIIRISRI